MKFETEHNKSVAQVVFGFKFHPSRNIDQKVTSIINKLKYSFYENTVDLSFLDCSSVCGSLSTSRQGLSSNIALHLLLSINPSDKTREVNKL